MYWSIFDKMKRNIMPCFGHQPNIPSVIIYSETPHAREPKIRLQNARKIGLPVQEGTIFNWGK